MAPRKKKVVRRKKPPARKKSVRKKPGARKKAVRKKKRVALKGKRSKTTRKADDLTLKLIHNQAAEVHRDILRFRKPELVFPVRSLSNAR